MTEDRNVVQASMTTFRIVEALKHRNGAGVTELANHLGLPKSTIHNHLRTLQEAEFIVREGDIYQVGLRFLDFGEFVSDRIELLEAARDEVDQLAQLTGELTNLMVEEHGRGVYIYRAKGDRAVNTNTHIGKRTDLHQTAMGKAILAHRSRERVEAIIDQHGLEPRTLNTNTGRDELFDELDRIRERGTAFDNEEWHRGLRCVAAPIRDIDDRAIGAVSVAGPVSRMKGERYETEIPDSVLSSANVIELNVEYSD